MRFEIRSGGIAGILFGVLLLSGAVFVMGLLSGYDIGHQSQLAMQQVATNYPLPPPPAGPVSAPPSVAAPGGGSAPAVPMPAPPAKSIANISKPELAGEAKPPAPEPVEQGEEPNTAGSVAASPQASPEAKRVASAESPPAARTFRRKPFNIQIQAAMDGASANEMVKRFEALGYRPHLLPTRINGMTWYKVEVGPYATQEEASAAEAELRRKYNAAYSGAAAPAQPSASEQTPEEE
jgi:DedD protein